MRTFAEELILVTALALGVSAIAAPGPGLLTPEEITALTAEKFAQQKLEDKIISEESRQKVLAAQKELSTEFKKLGYETVAAVKLASTSLGKLSAVRDPCRLPPNSPAYNFPGKEIILASLEIDKSALTCPPGAETLKMLLANQEVILKEEEKPEEKPDDPKPSDSKPKGDNASSDSGKKDASGEAINSSSRPPKRDEALGEMKSNQAQLPQPRVSAPQLGPLMGSSNKGAHPMGGFAGHRGGRAASPAISATNHPDPNQNLEIVRQALQQKILQREITPEVADNLMSKLSPALQKEPDLATALALTEWDSPAPTTSAKPRASKIEEPKTTTAAKPVTPKSEPSAGISSKPTSTKAESLNAIEATKEPEGVWLLNGAANSVGLSDAKKGALGATLASSIANAIAKKGAPLPSEDVVGAGDSSDYSVPAIESASSSTTLIESTPNAGTNISEPKDKSPVAPNTIQTGSFRRMIDRISLALHSDARKPASAEPAAFEHFAQTESVALASLGRATEIPVQTKLSAWTPVFFFFTPFTLTLVGFALWRWQKRRRA